MKIQILKPVFLYNFKRFSWPILLIVSFIQLGIWPRFDNFLAIVIILFAWIITLYYILDIIIFNQYPISCFMLLGYSLTQFYFPLLFTTIEGHEVTNNLIVPNLVFIHSIICLIILIIAHKIYRKILGSTKLFKNTQFKLVKLNLFTPPTNIQVWIMGYVGLISMFYIYYYSPSNNSEIDGVSDKFIQAITIFTYAPFYLLFSKLYGRNLNITTKKIIFLVAFAILLFLVSLGRNSRGAFMFGFTALGFGYFIGLLLSVFSSRIINAKNIVLSTVLLWLLISPLSDIATAMLIVRNQRNDSDRTELLLNTLDKFSDKKAIFEYNENKKGNNDKNATKWDEYYLDNIFLSRFCNLKFNDLSLNLAEKMGYIDPKITAYAIERPLAILPNPLINILNLDINKSKLLSFSSGDFLFQRSGETNALGSFRVGHFAGFGMASFGWWYLLFLFILIIPVYFLWDIFYLKRDSSKMTFSFLGLLSLSNIFLYINFENVLYIFQFLFRGWIQGILLYWLIFHFSKILDTFFFLKNEKNPLHRR
ncbi:hypothetical protein [Persicitalea jodogahamensis]|uniref:O-antigen polysaccharide polymerase Wzy n=1 Tax=Persicitalea jodogahamensis TaxID=402147 RepID=A0A8J3D1B9_9BACT|nr:hypothetical protein [Persicitalea jodogahamensis]GHB62958.1 hypothetical protein GCM10007390_15990 [Persicitalea jodogahamensis]